MATSCHTPIVAKYGELGIEVMMEEGGRENRERERRRKKWKKAKERNEEKGEEKKG
jgi:hypothetical protein